MSRSPEADRQAIRDIVEAWVVWRDRGDWERLSTAWHAGGRMSQTRFDGAAEEFVAQTRAAHARGGQVRHGLGGFWCEVRGDRAISIAGTTIHQRATVHGVEVDACCMGSFVDFWSHRDGRWAMDRRQLVYDRDRIDPVTPGQEVVLDADLLESFPKAYRHLAYLQHQLGLNINRDLPEGRGPGYDALVGETRAWLDADEAAGAGAVLPPIRRVVTTHTADGRSAEVRDGPAPQARTPVPGLQTTLMWITAAAPDYRSGTEAWPKLTGIAPPPGGSRFSVLDIAPGHRSAALHRTDTVDYVLCLSGQVDMLLDDGEVTLSAGDIAIQSGTFHGWHNRGTAPARVAVILLDAKPKRDGSVSGHAEAP